MQSWDGERSSAAKTQRIVLHVTRSEDVVHGTVDLPDFGALAVPASAFVLTERHLHFELVGDTTTAVFDGTVRGSAASGTWTEDHRTGTFELKRSPTTGIAFREEPVTFSNGNVRLSGTLLRPLHRTRAPAIVFVQGAGPERRYASRFLAEFFAVRGVAALIYDKRGTGASSGAWQHASFSDLAGDVVSAVTYLGGRSDVDPKRIGLMGSSQGGWIAPMAALRLPSLAFVIVKSAAATSPEKQELARVKRRMRDEGDRATEIAEALSLYTHAIRYARSGLHWDALDREIVADSAQKWALFDRTTPKNYWFFTQIRLNFDHDPIVVMHALRVPVFVIFGGEDEDGPPVADSLGPLIEAMRAGEKESALEIFPTADHDLRVAPTAGRSWDFPRFAPGYLDSLATWVRAKTR